MQKFIFLFVFLLAGCTVFGEVKLSEAETPVPRYNGSNPKEKWWRGILDRAEEKAAKDGKTIQLVFIGDSITHNLGKKENSAIWNTFIPYFSEKRSFLTVTERDECKFRYPRLCRYADLSRDCYAKSKVI